MYETHSVIAKKVFFTSKQETVKNNLKQTVPMLGTLLLVKKIHFFYQLLLPSMSYNIKIVICLYCMIVKSYLILSY